MVIQDLPNDVSKGKAAFSEYQPPPAYLQVTSAFGHSVTKTVPGPLTSGTVSASNGLSDGHFGRPEQSFFHFAIMPVDIPTEL